MSQKWIEFPVWNEWRDLTRLLWSGEIAFQTECDKWLGLTESERNSTEVELKRSGGSYSTNVSNHLAAIGVGGPFCSVIFLRSYALMETHAKLIVHILETNNWSLMGAQLDETQLTSIEKMQLGGGVESWSENLMNKTKQDWSTVYGGKRGLTEMSIVRNGLAHGSVKVSQKMKDDAARRGTTIPFDAGESLRLNFDQVHEYRARIRSFCRLLADGTVHLARGSHREVGTPLDM